MVPKCIPLIEMEMCQLKNAGKKLTFNELMPETDKLKMNEKGRGSNFTVFLMCEKEDPKIGVDN